MSSSHKSARAIARRLIELEESRSRSASSAETAPLEACYRLHLLLVTSVGSIGSSALVTRALRVAALEHPVLDELTVGSGGRPYFDRVGEAVQTHGGAAVAAGIEAFLVALLELLARFIGEDVVVALTERIADPAPGGTGGKRATP